MERTSTGNVAERRRTSTINIYDDRGKIVNDQMNFFPQLLNVEYTPYSYNYSFSTTKYLIYVIYLNTFP